MTLTLRPERRAAPDTIQADKWQDSAACNGMTGYAGNVFFPDEKNTEAIRFAKTICRRCPVMDRCLEDALEQTTNPEGIWGATTYLERAALRRRANKAAAIDEVAVERIMAGTLRVTSSPSGARPEFVEAIRRLNARELNDEHIGRVVGRTGSAITGLRRRYGIGRP